jgi:hypothetical protein
MPSLAPALNLLLGGSISAHSNNDIGAPQLPTKMEAEALFQRYLDAVDPMAHVLHIPSFKRLFERFWMHVEIGSPNQNSCTALILAVCMAAASQVAIWHHQGRPVFETAESYRASFAACQLGKDIKHQNAPSAYHLPGRFDLSDLNQYADHARFRSAGHRFQELRRSW